MIGEYALECPHCHEVLDAHETTHADERPPDTGALSVCWHCKTVSSYKVEDGVLKIVPIEEGGYTPEEMVEVRKEIRRIQQILAESDSLGEAVARTRNEVQATHNWSVVRLYMDVEERQMTAESIWDGPWPPPEQLVLVNLPETKQMALTLLENWHMAIADLGKEVVYQSKADLYKRVTCSKATDEEIEASPIPMVRGAKYVYERTLTDA